MTLRRRDLLSAFALTPFAGNASAAPAMRSLRIVTGFAAGATADIICRTVGNAIPREYAESVVVDNRTGASGQIAISYIKTVKADGSTLLLTPMSQLGLYPHIYNRLPYDPKVDVAPVSLACVFDFALAVGPSVPSSVTSVPEFLQWCKANPARANYATTALGSALHLIVEILRVEANVPLTAVLYRGPQAAVVDMIAGDIAAISGPVGDVLSYAKDPRIRLIGTWGTARSAFAPNIPTMLEQGLKTASFRGSHGFYLPAGATADVVTQTHAALATTLARPDVKKSFAFSCLEAKPSTPAELRELLDDEGDRWKAIIAQLKFTPLN